MYKKYKEKMKDGFFSAADFEIFAQIICVQFFKYRTGLCMVIRNKFHLTLYKFLANWGMFIF